jgi:hypothetical protein
MPGLGPGIHELPQAQIFKYVDGQDKPSHDESEFRQSKLVSARLFGRRPIPASRPIFGSVGGDVAWAANANRGQYQGKDNGSHNPS